MLAGVLPFRGDSMAELIYKIANQTAPDIRIVRPDLSEKLANIVAHSLSKRSETRYQNGDQFASDLRASMADFSGDMAAKSVATGSLEGAEKTENTLARKVSRPVEEAHFEATVAQSAVGSSIVPAGSLPSYEATQVINSEAAPGLEKTGATCIVGTGQPVVDAGLR